jgi:hypothetical protein
MPMAKPAPKWSLPLGSRQQCVAGNNAPRGEQSWSVTQLLCRSDAGGMADA